MGCVRILTVALLLSSTGCARRQAALYGPETDISAGDYGAILKTWTQEDKLYRGLDNMLFVTATFHSPELRRAFAEAFPAIYGHGGEITRRELVDLTDNIERFHTFFLAVYTPEVKWNDLDHDDSIWRLTLHGAVMVGPYEVTSVSIDENLRIVYPHLSRFDAAYLVRFPLADPNGEVVLPPETRQFSLRVSSALGTAEVKWALKPAPAPTAGEGDADPAAQPQEAAAGDGAGDGAGGASGQPTEPSDATGDPAAPPAASSAEP